MATLKHDQKSQRILFFLSPQPLCNSQQEEHRWREKGNWVLLMTIILHSYPYHIPNISILRVTALQRSWSPHKLLLYRTTNHSIMMEEFYGKERISLTKSTAPFHLHSSPTSTVSLANTPVSQQSIPSYPVHWELDVVYSLPIWFHSVHFWNRPSSIDLLSRHDLRQCISVGGLIWVVIVGGECL